MSETFKCILSLAECRKIRVSAHAYTRLAKRGILFGDVLARLTAAEVIEDYPVYHIGPAVLVLQFDPAHRHLHAVWGIETGTAEPAVLATAYYPDVSEWGDDLRSSRK